MADWKIGDKVKFMLSDGEHSGTIVKLRYGAYEIQGVDKYFFGITDKDIVIGK